MAESKDIVSPDTVACRVCLKEVPKSVAESLEGPDYVYYFCGPDCFQEWQDRREPVAKTAERERVAQRGGGR